MPTETTNGSPLPPAEITPGDLSRFFISLAVELGSSLQLPDFATRYTTRAAELVRAKGAALAFAKELQVETMVLHNMAGAKDKQTQRRLSVALTTYAETRAAASHSASAEDVLGPDLSADLGWDRITIARLSGTEGDLLGFLCFAADIRELELVQALAGHASIVLENARLFSRITQSNRQWAETFDAISDLILVHDERFTILRVNRSLADMTEWSPKELVGKPMRSLPWFSKERAEKPCPFCRRENESDEYVHPELERAYLISTNRFQGAIHERAQTVHILKDVTERREAERRYRELFDNIQEGVFFSTAEGRFVEVNEALVRMLGYRDREDLLGIDIERQLYLEPDQRRRMREAMERHGHLRNYEETLRRKDGTTIHTLQNAFVVRDKQGNITQYRGVLLDITELKRFQSQLQRERDFNTKILNTTQSMILVGDTAGLISYANRRCFEGGGYSYADIMGQPLLRLVAPSHHAKLQDAINAVLHGQQVDNLELPILSREGGVSHCSVNLGPMRDEQGNVNSMVAVMTDITDTAMLQAKLMQTEKMAAVGQLVSGVAHEVNNPLTAILGFADLLASSEATPADIKPDLEVIIQEAQRTKEIVQNLLSFARQTPPQRNPVQINEVLRRTLTLRSYDFSRHAVDVVENLDMPLPEIIGDPQQLQQVFLNVLNNAYDAIRETNRRGRIDIWAAQSGGYVEVHIQDSGTGVRSPERIFDPFFTTKGVGKGTGLGLSICYGIVQGHGGEITCHNNVGRPGATFVVRFPVPAKPAKHRGASA